RFDDRSRQTVFDFAGSMGVMARENQDGSFTFTFEKTGDLSLLASGDERVGNEGPIVMSLSREQARDNPALMLELTRLSGFEPSTNFSLHAGRARDGSIVLSMAIPRDQFDLSALENGFDRLTRHLDAAQATAR
ncbi:MAG: hypothetical protein AAGF76_14960, partial [Pseudomonadota bacterium]